MAKYFPTLALLLVLHTSIGCKYDEKDIEFSPLEWGFIDPYHEGDTLYFSDKRGNCDTVIIKDIKMERKAEGRGYNSVPAHNTAWVDAAHLQSDYWWGTSKSAKGNKEVIFQEIMTTVTRYPYRKTSELTIEFRNFHYSADIKKTGTADTVVLHSGKKSYSGYYTFFNQRVSSITDSLNIALVCLSPKEGLVAYKTSNDNWWVKR